MGQQRGHIAAALLLLATISAFAEARQCLTTIESSSPMFGAHWKKAFVTYSQETQWKRHGDMVKLNLFFDQDKGCLVGVKPTYGQGNSLAVRLGTEKTAAKVPVSSKHIQLGAKEKIISTHWKASSCIEYFKVSTNHGRYLEIGHRDSTAPLKTNKPASGAFLGFFKGFTDVVNTNAATGRLQQLQLFWVLRECDEPSQGTIVTESGPSNEEDSMLSESIDEHSGALLKKKKGLSFGMTEDGETGPVDTISVGITDGAIEGIMGNGTAGTETIIVVDEQTGEALAVGAPLSGNATGSYSYGGGDGNGTVVSFEHPHFGGGYGEGNGSSGNDTGLNLPFGLGKKHKFKKALHKLKHDLLWGADGNSTSDTANCTLLDKCPSGACLTPSCILNGAGKEVLTMMCYGTNIIPNPILDHTVGNPCSNLACQLDNANCTSGPLGLGGFCTGKVVRMGMTAKLHPGGAVWLGHPCIEHKGPLLAMLPKVPHLKHHLSFNASADGNGTGDYDGNGVYVSKAWKVCDCINGPGLKAGSLAIDLPEHIQAHLNLTAQLISSFLETKIDKLRLSPIVEKITDIVDGITEALSMFELSLSLPIKEHHSLKEWLPSIEVNATELPVMQQGVQGMAMPDVLAQWATAFATKAHLKKYIISQSKLNALRAFVPGFEVPSILVANVSSPLMKQAVDVEMPIFTIPDEALSSVSMLLPNITSLPLLCVPKILGKHALFNNSGGFAGLDVHNFTIPSMERVVERLLSIFPPPEWAVSIVSGKFAEVANKWMTGVLMDEAIPAVNVTSEQWGGLSKVLPGLNSSQTTLMLWNASSLLFTKPRLALSDELDTYVVPNELSANVSSICSSLVPGLPALLVPVGADNSSVPVLTLGHVTPPDLKITIDKLVSGIPGHPAFNITMPGNSILNFSLPLPLPLAAKLGHLAGIDSMVPGGMESVLEAFAGFDALKKNLTGLAGMHNISGDFADQAFVKLVGGNFTGIKLIPGNFTGLGGHVAAKAAKKEEGLAALKSLLGPKIAVMKAAKKHKAKILNITLSQ